jgi:hypothetical protein
MDVSTPGKQLLFTTSLIQTQSTAGTGFVFNVSTGQQAAPVLVTNNHVARAPGAGSFSLIAASADRERPELGQRLEFAHPDFASLWTSHPDSDVDVAAAFLGPFIQSARMQGKEPFYRAVSTDICPTDAVLADLDALEPIVFVGYPNALYDKSNLTPIIRQGITATPIGLDYDGRPQFLIDASVFPGSSGSPVFIYQSHYREGQTYHIGQSRILFAGVLAAVHVQPATGQIVTSTAPTVAFNQMLDLGIVFNHRAVIETVEALFAAHQVPYGTPPQPGAVGSGVEITETDEPPDRPNGGTGTR